MQNKIGCKWCFDDRIYCVTNDDIENDKICYVVS